MEQHQKRRNNNYENKNRSRTSIQGKRRASPYRISKPNTNSAKRKLNKRKVISTFIVFLLIVLLIIVIVKIAKKDKTEQTSSDTNENIPVDRKSVV